MPIRLCKLGIVDRKKTLSPALGDRSKKKHLSPTPCDNTKKNPKYPAN